MLPQSFGIGRTELKKSGAEMVDQKGSFEKAHAASNRFEADIIIEALQNEGIPVRLHVHEEVAYNGIFVPQLGWGSIMVPQELVEKAREIVASLKKTFEE
jgi:hypothetical protein